MTLRRLLFCALLGALPFVCVVAQTDDKARARTVRRAVSDAKTKIKAGNDLAATEQTLRTLLADSANRGNERLWLTLFDAVRAQHDAVNEKLYLKQESDTAAFFTHTLHLFEIYAAIDSLHASDVAATGAVPRAQQRLQGYLAPRRNNLYSGGGYFLRHQDYATAEQYFAAYVSSAPRSNDTAKEARAAYWALYCGYKLSQADVVGRYAPLALRDSVNEEYTLQYVAEAYAMQQDTAALHSTLRHAVARYPTNLYFFKQLATYYSRRQQYDSLLLLAEQTLAADSLFVPAMAAKSAVLFRQGHYDDCIRLCDEILAHDGTLLAAYVNAGLAYYNQTIPLAQKKFPTASEQRQRQELYVRALPYLEHCRQLAPTAVAIWGQPLYDVYLNLNMGDEFEDIEQLLSINTK